MASLLNALQLALGAGGAGISGYQRAQAQREEEERLKREEARRIAAEKKAAERQLKMDERQSEADAAALRRERREALGAGFVKASQYTGINPRDMPGATPRQPTERQVIGGEEYVLPEASSTVKHREGAMKMMAERKELDAALAAGEAAGMDPRKLAAVLKAPASVQGVIASRLFPAPERGGKEELSDTEKRRRGLQFLSGQTFNPALTKALQSTFAADPAMAEDPYMAVYDIMTSKTVKPITPMQRYKPPVEKEKADPVEELIKAGEERNKGKAGGAAAVSTPAAPAPRPAAAPTAPKPPAEPASMADAAAKQASRAELWDKLKAQNPSLSDDEITARVMREIP